MRPARAVILAVSHQEYVERGWELVQGLLEEGKGYVFDVQRMLDRRAIPAGIVLERL
jgi:UDP-N-acetyl-D-galactosamine dehydrogenase